MPATDSLYLSKAAQWAPYYAILQQELGATATLLNFGNQREAGVVNAATWTGHKFSATGLSPVWTPNEALSAWDTPFDLRNPANYLGLAPILTFNGTDERATTPDNAFFSRVGGVCSWGVWVNLKDATNSTLLAKYTAASQREYILSIGSGDQLTVDLFDETADVWLTTTADAVMPQGAWQFVTVTYDGSADATGLNLYQQGALVASTDADDVNFVSWRDTTSAVELGSYDITNAFFDGKMLGGPWSPFFVQVELTAAQVSNIYQHMRLGLGI